MSIRFYIAGTEVTREEWDAFCCCPERPIHGGTWNIDGMRSQGLITQEEARDRIRDLRIQRKLKARQARPTS